MNLSEVIDTLVKERSLDREKVIQIVCDGIRIAYEKRFPDYKFIVSYSKGGESEIFVEKQVVANVEDDVEEISLKKAKTIDPNAELGDAVNVPFEEKVGRIEILSARQIIASRIRELEQLAVYEEFKDRLGTIIGGTIHKKERAGYAVMLGEHIALLPTSCMIPEEQFRVGSHVRALLKEVLPVSHGGFQLILDRASSDFVQQLIELEIPEIFEGVVEVRKIVRIAGYKSKIAVSTNAKDIDPVGTCVGIGGARIKPILKELGNEKVDLIPWVEDLELLVKLSLKPAEIDKVEIVGDNRAIVWLARDQRSFAIGKMGQNIALASRLTGVDVQLQEVATAPEGIVLGEIEQQDNTDDSSEE